MWNTISTFERRPSLGLIGAPWLLAATMYAES